MDLRACRRLLSVVGGIAVVIAPGVLHGQGLEVQLKPVVDRIVSGCGKAGAKRVTVADFSDLQGQVTELGRYIAEEVASGLVEAEPGFGVVDRANLRTILAEHRLSMSGLVNPETAKKLGQIAGVDGIVTGTITPLGDTIRLSVKVVASDTAAVMASARTDVARTKAIEELLGRDVSSPEAGSAGVDDPLRGEDMRSSGTPASRGRASQRREPFSSVVPLQALDEYRENDTGAVERNSQAADGAGFWVQDEKWLLQRALGRSPVLVTHPCAPDRPSRYRVHLDGRPLQFTARRHPGGDSRVEFWAGGRPVYVEDFVEPRWYSKTLSFPPGTKEVEMRHVATGWSFEYLYWAALGPERPE